jgi:hypothetical protein
MKSLMISPSPSVRHVIVHVQQLIALTGWKGDRVIYFGDHIFHDLKEPSSVAGWKTGVIIRGTLLPFPSNAQLPPNVVCAHVYLSNTELEKEVEIQNSSVYRSVLAELLEVRAVVSPIYEAER